MTIDILIVDDDQVFLASLRSLLMRSGYKVDVAYTPRMAMSKLNSRAFDLVIIDRFFPEDEGLEIVQFVQDLGNRTALLMISGYAEVHARVKALRVGVDDFLAKPFNPDELLLKIEKLLFRKFSFKHQEIATSYFRLLVHSGRVVLPDKEVELRRKEFQILAYLIQHQNTIVSKEILLEKFWSIDDYPQRTAVDVHIRRLREKIGDVQKSIIQTAYANGYMFFDTGNGKVNLT